MLKIGDFSRLSRVSVKALRYYDEIDLLKPVKVDRFTGYRYYSVDQLPRLNRIIVLKNLGLSLEEVSALLVNNLSIDHIKQLLNVKQAEIRERLQEDQRRLGQVEEWLRQIEKEGIMPEYQVVIKKVEPTIIASIRDVLPAYSHIGQLFEEIFNYLGSKGGKPAGPVMFISHDPEYKEENVDVEAGVPLSEAISGSGRIGVYELPGMEHAACTIYKGSYEGIGEAYEAIMSWIESNSYQITGPDRDIYLTSPADTSDPASYVTEIQFPVVKK